MAYGITTDKNKINEAVQELMLYLLQANPEVIRKIYENDGIVMMMLPIMLLIIKTYQTFRMRK